VLDTFRLDGKVGIVTGASRGLGRAMALALAEAGADVAVAARSLPDLEETAHQVEKLGRLDILVNNSGVAHVTSVAEMPPEQFRRTIEVNLIGVFNGCRAAAARLIAQRSGKVINLASVLGASGLAGYSAYSASKGGVVALTRALAVEWARDNIQVNAIAPGWFVTDMNAAAFDNPKVRERLLRDVPARRTGRLEEIGPLLVYLASPASDYMTGQTVFLDGGHSAA
jgi:NAD(P)-dependent dehydrogenase (short-subunit alcohol dehydrogenase family)